MTAPPPSFPASAPRTPLARALPGVAYPVSGLTCDSRAVYPGWLFAALPGRKSDGRDFIPAAIRAGAIVVLALPGTSLPVGAAGVELIEDTNPRRRFAQLAAAFHGRQPDAVVAVTGTNGKTSTVQFARQIWNRLGRSAASLGTLGFIQTAPGQAPIERYGMMTTPDPVALHQDLAVLADNGVTRVALEASSHGLDQYRLDGVRIMAAGFTNFTRDHLDYHGGMEAYLAAKLALFERVIQENGTAVLNADVPEFETLAARCIRRGIRVWGYGTQGATLRLVSSTPLAHGQRLELNLFGDRPYAVTLPLVGKFQAWNALCALGLVLAVDHDHASEVTAVAALESLEGATGRMQHVATHPSGAAVFVDYAHTPDALETILTALRPHTQNRLVVVFGCGGDRDPGKRPLMGAIAVRLADRAILTDDNPRSEDPATIRATVRAGCPETALSTILDEIGDRRAAIRAGVNGLSSGDVLVIAGKGHEQGQIVGAETRPFDDATEARRAVEEVAR